MGNFNKVSTVFEKEISKEPDYTFTLFMDNLVKVPSDCKEI